MYQVQTRLGYWEILSQTKAKTITKEKDGRSAINSAIQIRCDAALAIINTQSYGDLHKIGPFTILSWIEEVFRRPDLTTVC